jgi:hypothetical protein
VQITLVRSPVAPGHPAPGVRGILALENAGDRLGQADRGTVTAEIIAFAGYWQKVAGSEPGMLAFDSQLTTYKILDQLTGRGINWLTLRQRSKNELERLPPCPPRRGRPSPSARAGRCPGCTRTWSRSRTLAHRSARSRSPASAATSLPG